MDLSVVTVAWNCEKFIAKQIESVKNACKDLEYEHIIIDNNSSDNTAGIINDQDIKLVPNKSNRGFSYANNQGVKISTGKYILFLNPDMELTEKTNLSTMFKYMDENDNVGIISSKLVDKKGEINKNEGPRRFPKVWEQLLLMLKVPHLLPKVLNKYHYKDLDLEKIQEVDTVRGSFMLVRSGVIKRLGNAFDERFFLWFEDVDFCKEVKKLGFKIVYNPSFSCVDLIGESFGQIDLIKKQRQFLDSMLIYFKKWQPSYKWIWLAIAKPIAMIITRVYAKLK